MIHAYEAFVGTVEPARCFLGGNDTLNSDAANPNGAFIANDGRGQWLLWPGVVDPLVSNARAAIGDAAYLFPINRQFNPNFKGVIYIDGKAAISGRLRGQVTVAGTGNIIFPDDITYVTDPSSGTCQDIMGVFSGIDVVVADNTLNPPSRSTSGTAGYRTYDDTSDEFFQGVVLALRYFWVENFWLGSNSAQDCGPTNWGRGCLFLTGGIIQKERGPVGLSSGYGYL